MLERHYHKTPIPICSAARFLSMRLVDRVAQYHSAFVVEDKTTQTRTHLNGAADFAGAVRQCPIRFVLRDDLTSLCAALAYSTGAATLKCSDLLHAPAELVWIEWCEATWQSELESYGFPVTNTAGPRDGRRGALVRSSPDGRCGTVRTFWAARDEESDPFASSMEAYFDFDTPEDEEPHPFDSQTRQSIRVADYTLGQSDVLGRCFRFRYERTWHEYYARAALRPEQADALARHALGCIALDIPMLLTFFLLLATRSGLPQRPQALDRINRSRARAGKAPLLDHIEALSPILPNESYVRSGESAFYRRRPRLHHVRGHLVRRGDQLFWRMPHLRGSARQGAIRTKTVTWTFEPTSARRNRPGGKELAPPQHRVQ